MSSGGPLLEVSGLRISARLAGDERTIVSGIGLEVAAGETIGIVGESGSGKSMTARALVGLLPAGLRAQGRVVYRGRELLGLSERGWQRMRGAELGLVFQDPFTMLSPVRRCGRHIDEQLQVGGRGLLRRERRLEAVRRLAEVGIRDPRVAERYPFELSGGMRQRVGIAAALARDPRLLIADEPSTALDVTTQREILWLLKSLQESRGMSLIMITHDLRVAFAMCDRIYVLYAGSMLEVGPASALEAEPRHPYTLGLLLSEPPLDRRLAALPSIRGSVPAPDSVAGECAFAQRCQWTAAVCRSEQPSLRPLQGGRASACVRIGEIRAEMAAERAHPSDLHELDGEERQTSLLLSAENVHKVFVNKGHQVQALSGVSIEVRENESVGLVGESGSGKTTFGRCVVGLETPSSGRITIDGIDASNFAALPARELKRLRQTVQIIFQDPYSSLNPVRTIGSSLREVLAQYSNDRQAGQEHVGELLARVGLPASYAGRKPVALSGGERQRVAIARALAVRPRLLICDEPVSALDVSVQAQILNLFARLRRELGMSYLFITHDLAVVRQVVERIYVLYKGEIVEQGLADEILDNPQHSYTKQLVNAIPRADRTWLERETPAAVASQGRG